MIRVQFAPRGEHKFIIGTVEVDGVDISRRVQAVEFTRSADGVALLRLDLVIHGDDAIDLEIPDEDLVVNAKVLKGGQLVEATAMGDAAKKFVRA